jgi:solute carrier family 25 (adenine nucleotide translocator) protein 4/5/6/31
MNLKNFAIDFTIGGTSAAISHTLLAPIERAKLLLSVQPLDAIPYKGFFDCMMRTAKEEGISVLYRGNLLQVIYYVPARAANFALKNQFQNVLGCHPENSYWKWVGANLLSGGAAGATTQALTSPFFKIPPNITVRGLILSQVFVYRSLYFGGYDTLKVMSTRNFQ